MISTRSFRLEFTSYIYIVVVNSSTFETYHSFDKSHVLFVMLVALVTNHPTDTQTTSKNTSH